jgi:putative copper export protein
VAELVEKAMPMPQTQLAAMVDPVVEVLLLAALHRLQPEQELLDKVITADKELLITLCIELLVEVAAQALLAVLQSVQTPVPLVMVVPVFLHQ